MIVITVTLFFSMQFVVCLWLAPWAPGVLPVCMGEQRLSTFKQRKAKWGHGYEEARGLQAQKPLESRNRAEDTLVTLEAAD